MCTYPRTVGRVAFDPAGMSVLTITLRKCSAAGFGALRFSRQSANRYLLHSQRVHLGTRFSSVPVRARSRAFNTVDDKEHTCVRLQLQTFLQLSDNFVEVGFDKTNYLASTY